MSLADELLADLEEIGDEVDLNEEEQKASISARTHIDSIV